MRLRPGPQDDGFAMVEVLVSAVVLIVMSVAILPTIDLASGRSGSQRARGVANALATADQNRLRSLDAVASLANYRATSTKTLNGTTYTVTSRADYVRDASGVASCTSSSADVDYLRLRSTVTWPTMGTIPPIQSDSLVAPPVGAGAGKGALSVQLVRADGSAVQGTTISAGGYSDATNSLGCVFFGNLQAGGLSATFNQAGWVTPAGASSVSLPATIAANQTTQVSQQYDQAGSVPVTFDTAIAGLTPTATGIVLSHPSLSTARTFAPGSPQSSITATNLFPFSSPYTVYAGQCKGNDPSVAESSNYFTAHPDDTARITPGGTLAPISVRVPGLTGKVINGNTNQPIQGATVKIYPDPSSDATMAGCTDTFTGVSPASGQVSLSVPFGTWKACVYDPGTRYGLTSTNIKVTSAGFVSPGYPPYYPVGTIPLTSGGSPCP